jgi:hypothetical protein
MYAIWKKGRQVKFEMSLEEVRQFIYERTPSWLYDESEVTKEQAETFTSWFKAMLQRYQVKPRNET